MVELAVKKLDHWRQEGILNPTAIMPHQVSVIGVGGIGSPVVMCLSKMGMERITVYDNDSVELHNLPNQFYRFSDIGKLKVAGIADIANDFAGVELKTENKLLTEGDVRNLHGITICGIDSLSGRRELWKGMKYNLNVPLYIDARMGGEVGRIFTVNPCDTDDVEQYEQSIADTIVPKELKCTERAIIYNTFMIASLVANQVKKFIMGEELIKEITFDLKTLSIFKM
jgi:molybdopterin/thiamine biosynthesis adenylyltransferase